MIPETEYTIGCIISSNVLEDVLGCIRIAEKNDMRHVEIDSLGHGMVRITFPMTDSELDILTRLDPNTSYFYAEMQSDES